MQGTSAVRQDIDKLISAIPTPYEYALLSRLAYQDVSTLSPASYPEDLRYYDYLKSKGWALLDTVSDSDYYGYVWVNDNTHQIVITHRGSQNATSWITDVESVVQLKPGTFIYTAIKLLSHPKVLEYRQRGYRLSSTGHSLGGFLAQICVFWSQRREFESTFYPDMSAVIFDSPGVVDFLEVIRSNLKSESNSIKLEYLNIHNFCAMPTLVSTYGTQTGTLWHLSGAEGVRFAFVNDHRLEHIIKGFDTATGYPIDFRQMTDWPQADYSAYDDFNKAMDSLKKEAIKAPFNFLNYLYKHYIKQKPTDTWYDQVFRREGQVSTFLQSTSYRPDIGTLEEQMTRAISSHYTTFQTEAASQSRIGLHHFDQNVQVFLSDLFEARKIGLATLGLAAQLKNQVGEEAFKLLNQFTLEKYGEREEVVLPRDYSGTIFHFQRDLIVIFSRHGIPSLPTLLGDKIIGLKQSISRLEANQQDQANTLQAQIRSLEEIKEKIVKTRLFTVRSAVANVPGSQATRILDAADFDPARREDLAFAMRHANPGDAVHIDGAVANAPGSYAFTVSPQPTEAQAKFMQGLSVLFGQNPSSAGNSTKADDSSQSSVKDPISKKP